MTTAAAGHDEALLERLHRGDLEALDAVAERLYRLAHGITRSAHGAEAVVREALAALLRPPEPLEPAAPLRARLYRTVTRAALARGGDRQAPAPLDPWLPSFLPDGHREGERAFVKADWSALPDGLLFHDRAYGIVHEILDTLTDVDRAIVLLADLEGLPAEEIGSVLDVSPAAVRDRLHRIRMALRERLTRTFAPPAALR